MTMVLDTISKGRMEHKACKVNEKPLGHFVSKDCLHLYRRAILPA